MSYTTDLDSWRFPGHVANAPLSGLQFLYYFSLTYMEYVLLLPLAGEGKHIYQLLNTACSNDDCDRDLSISSSTPTESTVLSLSSALTC